MSVVSKFNCMYCGRPIAVNYSAAFPVKEQTNGDEVDPPVPGGYTGAPIIITNPHESKVGACGLDDVRPVTAELRQRARSIGADPDRVDYSGCSDYRPEDNRLEQTGQGWAEPSDDYDSRTGEPTCKVCSIKGCDNPIIYGVSENYCVVHRDTIPSPFDIARDICRTWLSGKDLDQALRSLDEKERRAAATKAGQTAR